MNKDMEIICNELQIDLLNENEYCDDINKDFNCTYVELNNKIDSAIKFNMSTIGVVIYPTQNSTELEALYSKFMSLDDNGKMISNAKAEELFRKNNNELYELIKSKLDQEKIEDMDSYTPEVKFNESNSIFSNDLPLLTPRELFERIDENYSCFTESESESIKRWRQEYALMGMGIKTENYNKYNLERINILRKAIYENNNDAIIQCGWNPEIEFNSENRAKASEIVREKMDAIFESKIIKPKKCTKCGSSNIGVFLHGEPIFKCKDCGKYYVMELDNTNDKKAVSLVFVAGSSTLAKTIRKVQGTQFSHASISLDDDLSRIYSFNMRNGFNGFTYESVKNYISEGVTKMGVYTFLVSNKVYDALEKSLNNFSLYIHQTKYSVLNLLTIPINIPLDMNMKMVCSEFVDKLLKTAELDLTNKKSSLVGPKDLINAANTKTNIVEIFNGDPKKFNPKEAEKKIKKLKKSNLPIYEFVEIEEGFINEAKSFPMQFDSEGNLILKNLRKINFEQEYADSHRLLIEYDKTNSYDPMKFELAKMQFFITLLEKKIYKQGKDKSKDELKVRARFLNDFKKYLKIVNTNDPDFNFTEYYEQSPFNDALIQIDKSTLKFGFEALKYLIK